MPLRSAAPLLFTAFFAPGCDTAPSDAEVAAAVIGSPGEVRTYRDTGAGFQAAGVAPIQGLTSLDAFAEGEVVYLAGLSHRIVPTLLAEYMPQLFVLVAEASDPSLSRWTARALRVEAPGAAMIDPAMVTGPKGRELWFVQVDGLGDPAEGGKLSRVVRTRWTGTRFGASSVVYEGVGVVDPSPVYDGEAWRLFLTRNHREIIEVSSERPEPRLVVAGLTVPHASMVDGTLRLTAQDTSQGPSRAMELAWDGTAWSAPRALLPPGDTQPCSSASTVPHDGARWLFCAGERPGGQGAAP